MKEWKLLDLVFISFFRFTSDFFQVTVILWQEALGGNGHYFISVILISLLSHYSPNKIVPDTSPKLKITSVYLMAVALPQFWYCYAKVKGVPDCIAGSGFEKCFVRGSLASLCTIVEQ